MTAHSIASRRVLAAAGLACCSLPAMGRQTPERFFFSIDWHGPTVGVPGAPGGPPITEADLLVVDAKSPVFSTPVPRVALSGGDLGLSLYPKCVGHTGGDACGIELDALSFGRDLLLHDDPSQTWRAWFTVDEYARGIAGVVPSVATEAPVGDSSADVFVNPVQLPPGPLPPTAGGLNVGTLDGNGEYSASGFVYPGLGIVEPNRPGFGLPAFPRDEGDNIDAFEFGIPPLVGEPIFFSLDAGFFDPLVQRANSDSAAAHGVRAGDVLITAAGGTPVVYAASTNLGLDRLAGPGSDDLDALILAENGVPGFQPSSQPYDWVPAGAAGPSPTDMLLFSVRRGSAVIGQIDSIFGLPIEEGDVLTTPLPTALGGLSPFPGIFIAAENLGLSTTRGGDPLGDDMNGADMTPKEGFDCNGNGIEDSVDIACGYSTDSNTNGIPDECEQRGASYCECDGLGPCGNHDAAAGCANSTGSGAVLSATGTSSVIADDLEISVTGMPLNKSGLFFMGPTQIMPPFGDGRRCVGGGSVGIFRFTVQNSGVSGGFSRGPGLAALSCANFPPPGCIQSGFTWNFQVWYRDPPGPCGSGYNLSSGWSTTFTP